MKTTFFSRYKPWFQGALTLALAIGLSELVGHFKPIYFRSGTFLLLGVVYATATWGLRAGLGMTSVILAFLTLLHPAPDLAPLTWSPEATRVLTLNAVTALTIVAVIGLVRSHTIRLHEKARALAIERTKGEEQERSREDIERIEARYRWVVENAQEIIFSVDLNGRIVSLNPAFETLSGWKTEEWIGKSFIELVHPEDQEAGARRFAQHLRGEILPAGFARYRTRSGDYLTLELLSLPRNEVGGVTEIIGFARDVTERMVVQEKLRAQNELLEAIQFAKGVFIQSSNKKAAFEELLQRILRLTQSEYGFIGEVLRGEDGAPYLKAHALTNIAWNEATQKLYDSRMADGLEFRNLRTLFGDVITTERPVISNAPGSDPRRGGLPEGHPPLNAFLGLPITAGEGILGMAGIANRHGGYDEALVAYLQPLLESCAMIIQASRAESRRLELMEEVRQNQERLDLAVKGGDLGWWDADLAADELKFNSRFASMLGYTIENAPTSLEFWRQQVHPQDYENSFRVWSGHVEGNDPYFRATQRIRTQSGEWRWILIAGKIVERDAAGLPLRAAGIHQDIHDGTVAEAERQKLEEQVRHAQKLESLGILAGGIAHDFNNILTSIMGNANLARLDVPEASPLSGNLAEIEHAAQRAADLTQQMLAYSGRGRFVIERLNLAEIVREMTTMLDVSISKRCALRLEFEPNLPAVDADATQLRQIVMNLIINASDAIGENDGVIRVRTGKMICDRAYLASNNCANLNPAEGEFVYLEVADTGCGMPPEVLDKVFDPFFTTKFTGRGLGLAAVLGIVRGHRGTIKITSRPGEGTTFRVLFPAAASYAADAPSPDAASARGAHGTILVVDDERTVRDLASAMLCRAGYEVLLAEDGLQGLEIFRAHADKIRGILLDLTMPRMSGEEALREIRQIRADVPVLLTSGYSEVEVHNRFAKQEISGFVQKPYRLADLQKAFSEAFIRQS